MTTTPKTGSMSSSLKLADLTRDLEMVRFFWTEEHDQRDVGIHSYNQFGQTVCSESVPRGIARFRWAEMVQSGWTRAEQEPVLRAATQNLP